jgi:small subunit ribosomal protein S4e
MHIKRLAAPKAWHIKRKSGKFIIRPLPSGHPKSLSISLVILLRDVLGLAKDSNDAKRATSRGSVTVDSIIRKNIKFAVGAMDVVGIPDSKKFFRMSLDEKGRIKPVEIPESEKDKKVCKINVKKHVKLGKMQYGLHDGRTILADKKSEMNYKVNDSLLIQLPDQKILKHFSMAKGMSVIITSGKHSGEIGSIEDLDPRGVTVKSDKGDVFQTPLKYVFVLGEKKPDLKVR